MKVELSSDQIKTLMVITNEHLDKILTLDMPSWIKERAESELNAIKGVLKMVQLSPKPPCEKTIHDKMEEPSYPKGNPTAIYNLICDKYPQIREKTKEFDRVLIQILNTDQLNAKMVLAKLELFKLNWFKELSDESKYKKVNGRLGFLVEAHIVGKRIEGREIYYRVITNDQ